MCLFLKNLSGNKILTFTLFVMSQTLKVSHTESDILKDELMNHSLFCDWYSEDDAQSVTDDVIVTEVILL